MFIKFGFAMHFKCWLPFEAIKADHLSSQKKKKLIIYKVDGIAATLFLTKIKEA
jgi:hypothetical protein